ncbi:unnamed protein product [Peniophora sp. CBMAI 1063]|nr:unnamed protein product [Peniophora sp. CBMAI 1063]
MKFAALVFFACVAAVSARRAHPYRLKRDDVQTPTDTQVLNVALTLEHLENAFYSGALERFSVQDFANAGFQPWVRGRFLQIAEHEADHVKFLSTALGSDATRPCTYSFPYDDVKGFVDLSATFEQVGASAYTGAAKFISDKDYLTAAATILSTEARQAAWVESSVRRGSAWGTAYETPLDFNSAFTLASQFITECPSTNPALPARANPALNATGDGAPGSKLTLAYDDSTSSGDLYAAFLNGQNAIVVPLSYSKTEVQVPQGLMGYTYLIITKDKMGLDPEQVVAGPAIINVSLNADDDFAQVPL